MNRVSKTKKSASLVPRCVGCFGLLGLSVACSGGGQTQLPPKEAAPLKKSEAALKAEQAEEPVVEEVGPSLPWANSTFSPRPGSSPDPDLEGVNSKCGHGDMALHEVAEILAKIHHETGTAPSLDVANFHLRRRGSPYVMPRLWSATVRGVTTEQLEEAVEKWAKRPSDSGVQRCGVGAYEAEDGSRTVSALQVDVLAELQPVPTQVESGTWLTLESRLLVPTSAATVLLLPPEGPPRQLNTKLSGDTAEARFSIETEGTWLIQLMATQSGGPRPVAQLLVNADVTPPSASDSSPVPGEEAYKASERPDQALFQLMNAAREDQGLPPLKRNRRLDQVARAHSEAMMKQGRISHNTGQGDPGYRVEAAGMRPKATGENVALAGSVVRLHRVLWASPSHRENLLLRRWDSAGVAVVKREDGSLFATQLFADDD